MSEKLTEDLTESELDALAEIARSDRLKMALAQEHRLKLVDLGYAEERLHGIIATGKGRLKLKASGRAVS